VPFRGSYYHNKRRSPAHSLDAASKTRYNEIMDERVIKIQWDEEGAGWTAESEDVPGLVLESGSLDALIEKVRFAVPDLLKESEKGPFTDLKLKFEAERVTGVYA
jgi:hypothetical protein